MFSGNDYYKKSELNQFFGDDDNVNCMVLTFEQVKPRLITV